jgi:uncharacterized protein (TIGR03067 family)
MNMTKLKQTVAVLLVLSIAGFGSAVLAYRAVGAGSPATHQTPAQRAAAAEKPQTDEQSLQGTWIFVGGEKYGAKITADKAKEEQGVLVVKDDRVRLGSKLVDESTWKSFTFKLDPNKQPKRIHLTGTNDGNEDKTSTGIYALDGDDLKICLNNDPDDKEQPKEFATKEGSRLVLMVFKRKPASKEGDEPKK